MHVQIPRIQINAHDRVRRQLGEEVEARQRLWDGHRVVLPDDNAVVVEEVKFPVRRGGGRGPGGGSVVADAALVGVGGAGQAACEGCVSVLRDECWCGVVADIDRVGVFIVAVLQ